MKKTISQPVGEAGDETDGAARIASERRRQVEREGWSPGHDDQYKSRELIQAAVVYLTQSGAWPDGWDPNFDKRYQHSYERRLEIAGALIAAEIDRMERAIKRVAAKLANDDDDDPGGYNTHPSQPSPAEPSGSGESLQLHAVIAGNCGAHECVLAGRTGALTPEQAHAALQAIQENANLKAEIERLEKLVTTRDRHRRERYEAKTNGTEPAKGDWRISWYEADDDEPGCSGYMLSIPSGATKEQAEKLLEAFQAMDAMGQWGINCYPVESENRSFWRAVAYGYEPEDSDTHAAAILALAKKLEGR